jgi:hypothetical protein
MYGERLDKLVCIKCRICGRFTAIRLDPDDLDRHVNGGVFVQFAFPYLDSGARELLLTATCPACLGSAVSRPCCFSVCLQLRGEL